MRARKEAASKKKNVFDKVVLVTPIRQAATRTIEPHSKVSEVTAQASLRQLTEDWSVINQQVVVLLDETESSSSKSGFRIEEVSFKLGISAKGHIGFLAGVEAGGEASITLTFQVHPPLHAQYGARYLQSDLISSGLSRSQCSLVELSTHIADM